MSYEKLTGVYYIHRAALAALTFRCYECGGNLEVIEDLQTRTLHAKAVD